MPSETLIVAMAVVVAVIAAVFDWRERRIPNRLTYPALAGGLLLHGALSGLSGVKSSLGGLAFFGGVFLLFYLVRAMGAGDVKLAGALGAVAGFHHSVTIFIWTAIFGGIFALVYMVMLRQVKRTMLRTVSVVGHHLSRGLTPHPDVNLANPSAPRLPYGLAFAAGTLWWAASLTLWR